MNASRRGDSMSNSSEVRTSWKEKERKKRERKRRKTFLARTQRGMKVERRQRPNQEELFNGIIYLSARDGGTHVTHLNGTVS